MSEKWTISNIIALQVGTEPCWQVSLTRPDGTVGNHLMPTSTLEWRAAEYGVDPTDVDALLDIILHEPHMQTIDDPQHGPRYADDAPDLWTADNTTAAREAHVARIKTCNVRIDVRGVKALDPVRAGHRPDSDRIRKMREQVDTSRWLKKHGGLPVPPLPDIPDPAGGSLPTRSVPARRP
ncbi:hypothetical protein [Streptomyces sp. FL07-04A]|uniref:hypothetical protein n=1 Tax=Streptomyces sp. FL07-04A TaxID=3028658 RepID=UPI0029B139C2|nr:hypothetical protein [Streptomyces sp. FL07-04A]MDX3575991.1 hypothetical protein [Streptomyces sp. FL07-04A]